MDEMAGIGGGRPLGFGSQAVCAACPMALPRSWPSISREMPAPPEEPPAEQLALPIAQRAIGDICPECGEASFLNVEGCRKCPVCGYS